MVRQVCGGYFVAVAAPVLDMVVVELGTGTLDKVI